MGLLVLLPHYHCRRPPLEGDDPCLHTAHHRRFGAVLPRQIFVGRCCYSPIYGPAGGEQPHTDVVLLHLCHGLYGSGLPRRRHCAPQNGQLAQGHRCADSGRLAWRGSQPAQPLPHLPVCAGVNAWQGRTHRTTRQGPNGTKGHLGSRPRLHHHVELWH